MFVCNSRMEKRKYPIGAEHYEIYEEVGHGVSASVHRALCIPFSQIVAIKIFDFERDASDLNRISHEAQTMTLVDHPNVLKSYCSFVSDHNLWVVMPYMAGGSCLHILKAAYPDGFEEVVIATILRDVLKGLEYLHQHGHIHRDVKAGNILIDSAGVIKLGDFGVSACLFDSGNRQRTRNTFVGTPCWMAPEVMEQLHGYDFKADIWSFGITALELAHGHAPFSKYPPMKVFLMTLKNAPPGLDYERDKKFSKSFRQMIAGCLVKEPSKRPSAKKLLKHSFFKQGRSNDYIERKLLEGLPDLGDRMKALKEKEEDMVAQKKMPDGEKEELSQNEYKRGISSWIFDLEDVKAHAFLIHEEEIIFDKELGGSSNSSSNNDNHERQLESQLSSLGPLSDIEEYEPIQCQPSAVQSIDSFGDFPNNRCKKSDDDTTIAFSNNGQFISQCCPPHQRAAELPDMKTTKTFVDNNGAHHKRASSSACTTVPEVVLAAKGESGKLPKHPQDLSSCDKGTVFHLGDDAPVNTSKSSKASSANSDETEDNARIPVVQKKGRFKVTSLNVDPEKVDPSPRLHKSHSLQASLVYTGYHPTLSLLEIDPAPKLIQSTLQRLNRATGQSPASSLPSPSGTPSNIVAGSLFLLLQSFLQANITQRESILSLMKEMASGDFTANDTVDGGSMPSNIATIEKSLLEAAYEKEKELLQEIDNLRWRLICAQKELQKSKSENDHVNH